MSVMSALSGCRTRPSQVCRTPASVSSIGHRQGRPGVNLGAGPAGRPADRRGGGAPSTCMLLGLTYQLVLFVVDLVLVRTSSHAQLRAGVLALRHQLRVLERKVGKPAWRPGDRILLAALSRLLPRSGLPSLLPKQETLLRW